MPTRELLSEARRARFAALALAGALLGEMRRREIVAPALYAVDRLAWETRRRAQNAPSSAAS